ncbi:MAG: hypothetical protein P4M15_03220 [Alphaproteobacteria bacterium]|nr:hypothetical protein [Alphaproteobacteria bacterium]
MSDIAINHQAFRLAFNHPKAGQIRAKAANSILYDKRAKLDQSMGCGPCRGLSMSGRMILK